MPSAPETRYAKSGDLNIAYQVAGEDSLDLIYLPGLDLERRGELGRAWAPSPEGSEGRARGAGAQLVPQDGPRQARAKRGRRVQEPPRDLLPAQREPWSGSRAHADEHPTRRSRGPALDPGTDTSASSQGRPRRQRGRESMDRPANSGREVHRAGRRRPHHLERFTGHEIDMAGDGFFASFDGPARAIRAACAIRKGV